MQRYKDLATFKELKDQSPEALERLRKLNCDKLWCMGNLRHLTRPHGQRELYDATHLHMQARPKRLETMVWLCHRRLGKSFGLIILSLERLIKQPGSQVKYACSTTKQVREIIDPILSYFLAMAPPKLKIRPVRSDNCIYFRLPSWPSHTESKLVLVGLDYKQGDSMRGTTCDMAVLDEVRDIMCLEYIMADVLAAQFIGRDYPMLVMASTPPASMEHPFVEKYVYYPDTMKFRDTTYVIPASKNADWTKEDEEMVTDEIGGKGSLAYRREIECELISDTSDMVIPESHEVEDYVFLPSIKRPDYYIPYVSLDTGWVDHAGCLFGYLDFDRQKLCIIGEIFEQYLTLGTLSDKVIERFKSSFDSHNRQKSHWVADCDLQALETLRREYNCLFVPAQKHDRKASIASFRTGLVEGRIEIDSMACPQLIRQMKYGIYKPNRKDFMRTKSMGHLDLIMAAVYMFKKVGWSEMPFRKKQLSREKYVTSPNYGKRTIASGVTGAIKTLLGRHKY